MLSEAEDSKMLFGEAEPKPAGTGDPIGGVGGTGAKPQADSLIGALTERYNSK